jgi:hypothetical protein
VDQTLQEILRYHAPEPFPVVKFVTVFALSRFRQPDPLVLLFAKHKWLVI